MIKQIKFQVDVLSGEKLINNEAERVRYYLTNYDSYKQKGIHGLLRFPDGISPGLTYETPAIRSAILAECQSLEKLYTRFSQDLILAVREIAPHITDLTKLYGFNVHGLYRITPTAFGTIGGTIGLYDSVAFRLPGLYDNGDGLWEPKKWWSTGKYRTTIELITHEVLCHKVTTEIRAGTALDEEVPNATHQWHKEYLMDLLGRTFLTETGLMKPKDVTLQIKAIEVARKDIDPIYFDKLGNITWRGNVTGLMKRINSLLNGA
ncbi:MAG: hypothetical protein UT34_C0001G0302 [candidate division WS6 bacterium GW2011_GWF2_39_15]|uniref:Uncharacterized protein n=1 Tax=candidate division WS6 bacterium GW2011_GWF2_39_15 TaxID=1619100 RepID=A0A0G0QXB8_9BACT|nr:MAG: hypothetical protein UT34_C0001G0302 [candidate division WS6 bacterium GW2011_GWF2_39_15]